MTKVFSSMENAHRTQLIEREINQSKGKTDRREESIDHGDGMNELSKAETEESFGSMEVFIVSGVGRIKIMRMKKHRMKNRKERNRAHSSRLIGRTKHRIQLVCPPDDHPSTSISICWKGRAREIRSPLVFFLAYSHLLPHTHAQSVWHHWMQRSTYENDCRLDFDVFIRCPACTDIHGNEIRQYPLLFSVMSARAFGSHAEYFSSFFILASIAAAKEKSRIAMKRNAYDNPAFLIDYNVASSSCSIRKLRFLSSSSLVISDL